MILLLALLSVSNAAGSASDSEPEDYNCAVNAVYAAFRSSGMDVNYETVAGFFSESNQQADAQVPMDVLQQVLIENGLRAESVKYQSLEPGELLVPSILLIYPRGVGPQARGHYVYLKTTTDDEVHLIDPDSLGGEIHVPREQLQRIWEGHAILINPPGWTDTLLRYLGVLIPLLALYQLFLTVRHFLRRRRNVTTMVRI